jgi:ribosomal protein L14E/L6E/L27E
MIGMLAKSKAGHDKDQIYVILREEGEYVYLVDGRIRTMDKPKKKNRKHIQIIKKVRLETDRNPWGDLEVKKIIKDYNKEVTCEEEEKDV